MSSVTTRVITRGACVKGAYETGLHAVVPSSPPVSRLPPWPPPPFTVKHSTFDTLRDFSLITVDVGKQTVWRVAVEQYRNCLAMNQHRRKKVILQTTPKTRLSLPRFRDLNLYHPCHEIPFMASPASPAAAASQPRLRRLLRGCRCALPAAGFPALRHFSCGIR